MAVINLVQARTYSSLNSFHARPRLLSTLPTPCSSAPPLAPIYVSGLHLKAHCTLSMYECFGEHLILAKVGIGVRLEAPEAFSLHMNSLGAFVPFFRHLWITRRSVRLLANCYLRSF